MYLEKSVLKTFTFYTDCDKSSLIVVALMVLLDEKEMHFNVPYVGVNNQ